MSTRSRFRSPRAKPAPPAGRAPAAAGILYPAEKRPLAELVQQLLHSAGDLHKKPAIGAIVPHGAYSAAGATAAAVYAQVEWPPTLILLGPAHSGDEAVCALQATGCWETPLGKMPIEKRLAKLILAECADLKKEVAVHREEHALELQLPFLQRIGTVRGFVPILLTTDAPEVAERIGAGLVRAIRSFRQPVAIVVSTDLSRYEPQETVKTKDRAILEAIQTLDAAKLWAVAKKQNVTMCGVFATMVLLHAAGRLGAREAVLARYQTSSETTGNFDSVVGYAGMVIR